MRFGMNKRLANLDYGSVFNDDTFGMNQSYGLERIFTRSDRSVVYKVATE